MLSDCPCPCKQEHLTRHRRPPSLGVYVSLDQRMIAELILEMETAGNHIPTPKETPPTQGIRLAQWDDAFSDALVRLLQLVRSETDTAVL